MESNNISNHKHSFFIGDVEIELVINCKNGFWKSDIVKGKTGMGSSSGGSFRNLSEYIKNLESEHRYAFQFFYS